MKNARVQLLILLTCISAAFTVGLLAGRTINRVPVHVQLIPVSAEVAASKETETIQNRPEVVNINTATIEQLQELPDVGPVLAERIIAYRNDHGAFTSIGELMCVPGIGEKKLEVIWDYVTTGG